MPEPKFDDLAKKVDDGLQGSFEKEHGGISGSAEAQSAEKNEGTDAGERGRELGMAGANAENERVHDLREEERLPEAGNIAYFFNQGNKGFFGKMSEKGKEIMNRAYDGLYKIPVMNRIVGKLEVAFNQSWADGHQERMVSLKDKMDDIDAQCSVLDSTKEKMKATIAELKRLGVPGDSSLLLDVEDLQRQHRKLLDKKNTLQSKFEASENVTKFFINKRDAVADKLIGYYNEKLEPMEKNIERLEASRDQVDLQTAVMEAKHNDEERRLERIEGQIAATEESYRGIRKSEGEIKKRVAPLAKLVAEGREKIRVEKENLARRRDEINQKIAKIDKKANPCRDKRDKFVRIKDGRPIDIPMETRTRAKEFSGGREDVKSHMRGDNVSVPENEPNRSEDIENNLESAGEEENRPTVEDYISSYNSYLNEQGGDLKKTQVVARDFLRATWPLSSNDRLDFERFKKIMKSYYKVKKIPTDKFSQAMDGFREKIEARK